MKPLLLVMILLMSAYGYSQQKHPFIWGYLKDSVTQEPIILASVTNLNTRKTVMTSANGRFKIELSQNDILSFAAVGYYFDTIRYANQYLQQDTLALTLAPLTYSLGNVTVTAKGMSRYQTDSMERRKNRRGCCNSSPKGSVLSPCGSQVRCARANQYSTLYIRQRSLSIKVVAHFFNIGVFFSSSTFSAYLFFINV